MNSLENAKVGDKLIMTSRWNQSVLTIEKVQKNLVIANDYKFRKSDGSLVSSDKWSITTAKIATERDLEAFRKAVLRNKMIGQCRDLDFSILSDSQLEQILEIANKKDV